MKNFTQQDIERVYDNLPEHIQAALGSPELTHAAAMLGEKNDLHIDQIDTLIQEVAFALAGLTKADEFVERLEANVRIPHSQALELGKDIDSIVFEAVRDALRDSSKDEYVNEEVTQNADPHEYIVGEGDAIRIKGVNNSSEDHDHIPEHEHPEVRNELLRAIEENDTLSTTVISSTEPITIQTQQKTMDYTPTNKIPVNSGAERKETEQKPQPQPQTQPQTDIANLLKQTPPKSRPSSTDPYREPIELGDTKPAFLKKLYTEE